MKKIIMGVMLVFTSFLSNAQEDVFQKVELGYTILENEKWSFDTDGSWKYSFAKVGWNRWGLNFGLTRKLNNWLVSGGVSNYYTSDRQLSDSYELRPWIALELKTPIIPRLSLYQKAKTEWRNQFFEKKNVKNVSYGRFRYKIGLDLLLSKNKETIKQWRLKGDVEWYFLKDKISSERYSVLRDYTLKLIKKLQKGKEFYFGVEIEKYLKSSNDNYGYTYFLGYHF